MRNLLILLSILPFFTISQNVLDGIYIAEHVPQLIDYAEWSSPIGGEMKMGSPVIEEQKKPLKIKGFEHINSVDYIPVGSWPSETLNLPNTLNSHLYSLPNSSLIGIVNYGDLKTTKDTLIQRSSNFYIKRGEVTNAEYREFVQYVKDSLLLSVMSEDDEDRFMIQNKDSTYKLNWESNFRELSKMEEYAETVSQLYFEESDERFYRRPQFDSRKLNYEYKTLDGIQRFLNIYPDTLSWLHNSIAAHVEPLCQMYFWHPVYDHYPVCGVSYNQIQAYLYWLHEKGISGLDKKGIKYEIGLPTSEEWEYTTTLLYTKEVKVNEDDSPLMFNAFLDKNVNCDLVLSRHQKFKNHEANPNDSLFDEYQERLGIQKLLNPYSVPTENLILDGFLNVVHSEYSNENFSGLYSIKNQVFHLGSNVSEWLETSFSDYKDYFTLNALTLAHSPHNKVAGLGFELEQKLNGYSDEYQLVMGANWMDERYSMYLGAPLEATYAKTFVHPDSAFSTLGFRYVIRLVKDQQPTQGEITFQPENQLNIFEELKKIGFYLIGDSLNNNSYKTEKLTFINHEKKKEVEDKIKGNETFSKTLLTPEFPELLKKITAGGADVYSFYSTLPNQPQNLLMEYRLKCINEYTFELIRI
jgi:formylglycine-generating enzyme required for sulfatase activity